MLSKYLKAVTACIAVLALSATAHAAQPSGTLPVITITTDGAKPIESKEKYVKGSYSVDPCGNSAVEALSGTLQVKGRGNYTWTGFDKKPYRLKLDEKAKLMGMKKSKHFALLAHADDNLGFLREAAGFRLSQLTGLAWTPDMQPVELILNGDYLGLYFLVETIRVDKDRVNIFDQEDEIPSTDVTGGWLCEIDNYDDEFQIKLTEGNGETLRVTHKSPEEITPEQRQYLTDQYTAMDRAVYNQDPDNNEWETLIDIESLASFYVVQEILDNHESFHGSCYMHRDRGQDQKWKFGPVWDFGSTMMRDGRQLIFESAPYNQTWIGQLATKKSFQEAYKARFASFLSEGYDRLIAHLDAFASKIEDAARADAERWPQYGNPDIPAKLAEVKNKISNRISFLCDRWNVDNPIGPAVYLRGEMSDWNAVPELKFSRLADGTYILRDVDLDGKFKIADDQFKEIDLGGADEGITVSIDSPVNLNYRGKDLSAHCHVPAVLLTIADDRQSGTLTLSSKVPDTSIDYIATATPDTIVSVNGGDVTTSAPVDIYDLGGRRVAHRTMSASLHPGIYIVRADGMTVKVAVGR